MMGLCDQETLRTPPSMYRRPRLFVPLMASDTLNPSLLKLCSHLHIGGGLFGAPKPLVTAPLPLVKPLLCPLLVTLPKSCWPRVALVGFGGSKPNRSLLILLPPPVEMLVSVSGARGSKSLSESELSSNPSSLVPTDGLNASSVLLIWKRINKVVVKIVITDNLHAIVVLPDSEYHFSEVRSVQSVLVTFRSTADHHCWVTRHQFLKKQQLTLNSATLNCGAPNHTQVWRLGTIHIVVVAVDVVIIAGVVIMAIDTIL